MDAPDATIAHAGTAALGPALADRFRRRDATIGVGGLGYVGLPICITSAAAG